MRGPIADLSLSGMMAKRASLGATMTNVGPITLAFAALVIAAIPAGAQVQQARPGVTQVAAQRQLPPRVSRRALRGAYGESRRYVPGYAQSPAYVPYRGYGGSGCYNFNAFNDFPYTPNSTCP